MSDERALEALGHLQAAALETIAAVRALLDVAEAYLRDPARVTSLIGALAPLPDALGGDAGISSPGGADRRGGSPSAALDEHAPVTRIKVS